MIASLDSCLHKLEQQLRKYKQKVQDHHKGTGLKQQPARAEPEAGPP
ncbi:MAG: HPF/RaiA family ribosome-associated protein [Candidatus Saccharimonadales bacterium]